MPPSYFATFCWSTTWPWQAWQVCQQQSNVLDELGQDCGMCPVLHFSLHLAASDVLWFAHCTNTLLVYTTLPDFNQTCTREELRSPSHAFHFSLHFTLRSTLDMLQWGMNSWQSNSVHGEMAEEEKMMLMWKNCDQDRKLLFFLLLKYSNECVKWHFMNLKNWCTIS